MKDHVRRPKQLHLQVIECRRENFLMVFGVKDHTTENECWVLGINLT